MWGGGINFLSHESSYFNVYSYSPIRVVSLNNKTASSVCVARDGKLWIGTDGEASMYLIKASGWRFIKKKPVI